jgi:hypothetical protein
MTGNAAVSVAMDATTTVVPTRRPQFSTYSIATMSPALISPNSAISTKLRRILPIALPALTAGGSDTSPMSAAALDVASERRYQFYGRHSEPLCRSSPWSWLSRQHQRQLDTGAEIDVISPEFVKKLKLKTFKGTKINAEAFNWETTQSDDYVDVSFNAKTSTLDPSVSSWCVAPATTKLFPA